MTGEFDPAKTVSESGQREDGGRRAALGKGQRVQSGIRRKSRSGMSACADRVWRSFRFVSGDTAHRAGVFKIVYFVAIGPTPCASSNALLVKWPSFVVWSLHGSVNFSAVISISRVELRCTRCERSEAGSERRRIDDRTVFPRGDNLTRHQSTGCPARQQVAAAIVSHPALR